MKYAYLFIAVLLLTVSSCSGGSSAGDDLSYVMNADMPMEANGNSMSNFENDGNTDDELVITDRKLIWTADLIFQVKNVDSSTNSISQLCSKYGGFISDMQLTNNNYRIANIITLRVPNEEFHSLISDVKGESVFLDQANINSNDVTEEFVDLESRLKTKREVRERYIDILRNKTGTIEDVLQAEEAIRTLTEEIEAKEGRLRYLKDQVGLSTISVEVYQKVDYVDEPSVYDKPYSEEVGESFGNGWTAIKLLFLGLVAIWPLLLILTGVLFWKRKWLKGLFRKS
ncbi:MAG: DUF4349 domain-containing protein [Crocinitomicaceae bacterium]|nr:DUF4349 domain-containing protein [Crocinitomicaceae bacterium]